MRVLGWAFVIWLPSLEENTRTQREREALGVCMRGGESMWEQWEGGPPVCKSGERLRADFFHGLQRKPALPEPWPWTFSLQNCGHLASRSVLLCYSRPCKLTHHLYQQSLWGTCCCSNLPDSWAKKPDSGTGNWLTAFSLMWKLLSIVISISHLYIWIRCVSLRR